MSKVLFCYGECTPDGEFYYESNPKASTPMQIAEKVRSGSIVNVEAEDGDGYYLLPVKITSAQRITMQPEIYAGFLQMGGKSLAEFELMHGLSTSHECEVGRRTSTPTLARE